MSWSWEYIPSEEYVTSGAPADFLKAVEEKAGELVRAAEALFLDGTTYEGSGEPMQYIDVAGGFFAYYVVPRLELVFICQVTPPLGR
ncbi:hypothetical protein GCM10010193_39580 [Kitasatospora atroaurantiaca]|uniref:Uncharacterized protein n=1 Tax=Kitasatospora atroaurantiaca TaxID=285545 RepID=A0A561EMS2_9ACTN|nr:hypothetical protein [Kitasatospora atroaurantiaca]TWE16872.1 hypothetical protein FB465_1865 [Kitasatospora atroaurantiaca]